MSNTITPTVFYHTLKVEGLEIFNRAQEPSTRSTAPLQSRTGRTVRNCWFFVTAAPVVGYACAVLQSMGSHDGVVACPATPRLPIAYS